jgi:hypothetical protein
MIQWKWPFAVGFVVLVAGMVFMFVLVDDPTVRDRILGYFDSIVPFVVGAAAGGSVGGAVGYARGAELLRKRGQAPA